MNVATILGKLWSSNFSVVSGFFLIGCDEFCVIKCIKNEIYSIKNEIYSIKK